MAKVSRSAPILTVSVAAELAGMHAQTVRQYDRLGLVPARRARGGGRRYSLSDVDKLIEVQRLSQEEGINLSGIARILELKREVEKLEATRVHLEKQLERMSQLGEIMRAELERQYRKDNRVFAASAEGQVMMAERLDQLRAALRRQGQSDSQDLVVWNPRRLTLFPS